MAKKMQKQAKVLREVETAPVEVGEDEDLETTSVRAEEKLAIGQIKNNPASLRPENVLRLQQTLGNRAVQRLIAQSRQSSPAPIQRKPESDKVIQRAFVDGLVTEVAHLHKPQVKDATLINASSSGAIGSKLKPGTKIQIDTADFKKQGALEWPKGKTSGPDQVGYIRPGKFYAKDLGTLSPTTSEGESGYLDSSGELSEQVSGVHDTVGGGIEMGDLKTSQGGMWKDKSDSTTMSSTETAKAGLDSTAGALSSLSGIFGMIGAAKQMHEAKDGWERLEGGFAFTESLVKTGSGMEKIVDSIAKATGSKSGVGKSDIAGKFFSAVGDGLGAVKSAAMGLIGLYKLYKSQSSEKPKEALATFKLFVEAAGSAAKVAKTAYDIIGNGIPMSVMYAIPGLSIGVSAINIIIRLWDAITAGKTKKSMTKGSDTLRTQVVAGLGVTAPTDEAPGDAFDKDRRGTFPAYKTYFRTKQTLKEGLTAVKTKAHTLSTGLVISGTTTPEEEKDKTEEATKELNTAVETNAGLPDRTKTKIKGEIGTPVKKAGDDGFDVKGAAYMAKLVNLVNEYEFADKMGEINQKRQVGGWTDVILELVSIAGDIVTIVSSASGVGAAVGQGIKAASAGYKAVHSGSKFIQKLYRNNKKGPGGEEHKKSTNNKHKEYVGHARFIYEKLASLDPSSTTAEADAKLVIEYIKATGVNYGMWLSMKGQPDEQVNMLVEAMKAR